MPVPPGLRMLLQLLSDLQLQVSRNCLNMSGPGLKCASIWWFSLQLQNFPTFSKLVEHPSDLQLHGTHLTLNQPEWGLPDRRIIQLEWLLDSAPTCVPYIPPPSAPTRIKRSSLPVATLRGRIHWADKILWRNYIHNMNFEVQYGGI